MLVVNGFNQDFTGWGKEDSELVVRFYKYGLKRKDIRFRAASFHLHHPEFSRENLRSNMELRRPGWLKANTAQPVSINSSPLLEAP